MIRRRDFLLTGGWGVAGAVGSGAFAFEQSRSTRAHDLTITEVTVTPIALPDPPILAASGCHGPYYLRNIIEIRTADGIVGIGETVGGEERTTTLQRARERLIGSSAFAYRKFQSDLAERDRRAYAGIELACLDAIGRATGQSVSRLLGGPVRDEVEFGAYLFFRYASDDPRILDDSRIVDGRGRGDKALDQWGDVRTPESMAQMAWQWHQKWGFRHQKLKGGVLAPDVELAALRAINERFGGKAPLRIDPNGRWTTKTAIRIGEGMKDLPVEYYEDPVGGQEDMAEVRQKTGLKMSTNMCVTAFTDIPQAVVTKPIDVVLCDHHYWGGIPACQALGTVADALGWSLSQHSNSHAGITMAAMIHVGAVVPQLTHPSDTHYPWLAEDADIIEGPKLAIRAGRMQVPTAPGLGVNLDRDKLARAHEIYNKCGMRQRDDAALMRRLEPGWERTEF